MVDAEETIWGTDANNPDTDNDGATDWEEVLAETNPLEGCGDGIINEDESCDDGNTVTEACDYGDTSCEVCNDACDLVAGATAYCGDSTLNGDEVCDDGNTVTEVCDYGDTSCSLQRACDLLLALPPTAAIPL